MPSPLVPVWLHELRNKAARVQYVKAEIKRKAAGRPLRTPEQKAVRAAYNKARRADAKLNGRCVNCVAQPAVKDRAQCSKCLDFQIASQAKRTNAHKAI